jgi:hypothetical protein
MRVYGKAGDENDNFVRIHDDPKDYSEYPGKTYSAVFMNVNPTAGGIDTYDVGSYKPRWTAMAVLAFGLYRYHSGLSDKEFHVAIDDTTSGGSSAHSQSQFNASITEGRHLLRLGNGEDDGTPQTKYKFIVTHELGHAIAALYYGNHDDAVDGPEPTDEEDYSYTDDTNNVCGAGVSSTDRLKGMELIGFREGFAHFIAAKIWNYKDNEGTFTWFGTAHDLERITSAPTTMQAGDSRTSAYASRPLSVALTLCQGQARLRIGCGSFGTGIQPARDCARINHPKQTCSGSIGRSD